MNAKISIKPTEHTVTTRLHKKVLPLFLVTADDVPVGEYPETTAKHIAEALRRVMEHADTLSFALWLLNVDVLCTKTLGVGLFDLPDMMTRDAFEDGVSPADFFQEQVMDVAREEGYPG